MILGILAPDHQDDARVKEEEEDRDYQGSHGSIFAGEVDRFRPVTVLRAR